MKMSRFETLTHELAATAVNLAVRHSILPDLVSYGDVVNADIQLLQAHLGGGLMDADSMARAEQTILSLRRGGRVLGGK